MMRNLFLISMLGAVAAVAPAQAVTYFSLGATTGPAPGDPGLAAFETPLVTFDTPLHAGITETDVGTVGLFTGTSGSAAAPAGDTTRYLSVGTDGSATFDFRTYFASRSSAARSISVYIGSIDLYNHIDILDGSLNVITTINGADLPGNNGDQGASVTNRRLYINFDPSENVGGLRFSSGAVAFEFDTIGASSAIFNNGGNLTPPTLPFATNVPEPASWALMLTGFAMIGLAARRRKPVSVTA